MHPFFLRVMVGTGIHTQPSASLHTPPVYIDYIIILSYRLRRVSALWPAPSSRRNRGSNRGFSRLTWSAEPTLLSVLWYKPWLVVGVVGGGGHSFFLRVGRYRYPQPAQCKFAYPPRLHRLHRLHKDSIIM